MDHNEEIEMGSDIQAWHVGRSAWVDWTTAFCYPTSRSRWSPAGYLFISSYQMKLTVLGMLHVSKMLAKGVPWECLNKFGYCLIYWIFSHKMIVRACSWRKYLHKLLNMKLSYCPLRAFTTTDHCTWYWMVLCILIKEKGKYQPRYKLSMMTFL